MDSTEVPAYKNRAVAVAYDALNQLLWLPGGSDRLRRELVDRVEVFPGANVLELGCGTGMVTRHLITSGASVVAVDDAATMLAAARRRAPAARFIEGDVAGEIDGGPFDRVVFSFVLHELDPSRRLHALERAVGLLGPGGRIGILEWATPARQPAAGVWRTAVRTIEPSVAHDVLDDGLDVALSAAGLAIVTDTPAAGGRARIAIAGPSISLHPRSESGAS